MLGARIDRLGKRYPAFERFMADRIYVFFRTSAAENILVCLTAGIAAGILDSGSTGLIRAAAQVTVIIVWLQCPMLAGFLRQWSFLLFSVIYFLLPTVFSEEAEGADSLNILLHQLAERVFLNPERALLPWLPQEILPYILLGGAVTVFIVGNRFRADARGSELYCRTRLEQLS